MSRYVLLLSVLVVACHEKPAPAPVAPQPAPRPAPAPAPIAAPVDAGTVAAATADAGPLPLGVALSLVSQGDDGCRWERLDIASGQRQPAAIFPGKCSASVEPPMAWSADGKMALWNDGEALWRVALDSGQKTKLPPTPEKAGAIDSFGFDRQGHPMALTVFSPGEAGKLEWEGKTFKRPEEGEEGIPSLAHAFRLGPDDRWQHLEVKITTEGTDYSPGVHALDALQGLLTGIDRGWGPHGKLVHDAKLVAGLNALFHTDVPATATEDDERAWVEITEGVYDREETWEGRHSGTLDLAFEHDGKLTKAPQLPEGKDDARVESKGDWVLIASGSHVRVYRPKQEKVVFSADTLKDARFWP